MPDQKVIIQISDVHVVGEGLLYDRVDTTENLAWILTAIESTGAPDLLLFTGDLADKAEPAAYRRLRDTVEPFATRMGIPVLYQPGNHDARSPFREHLLGWEATDEPIDQVVWSDGLRVIALDSTVPGAPHGELADTQLAWLEAELATAAPLGTILALHHPPIVGPSQLLNTIILRDPERLGKVVEGTDVKMVVAGHTHHTSAGILGGVPVWVATATAYQQDVLSIANSGIRGIPGSAFSRIDVADGTAVATHIPVIVADRPLYEIDSETLRRYIEQGASVEEVEASMHASASRE
jgi:3',5'-cyclic-AMP phosphodiesterase